MSIQKWDAKTAMNFANPLATGDWCTRRRAYHTAAV
ncbi:hypothetical protein HNQ77_003260 [Silvibacterium bohemicum]|uniref:Uncharacterized protein n=1 Tax=Silvibacterium bohemicum TaxID=1577686 RepID=A0A841JV96_9BACT|nr:hypothetical protein [Silvibacterium bohemicum]